MQIYTYRSGNKTLKRVLSITLSLLVLVQMIPVSVFAAPQGAGAIWTNTGPCGSPQNVNLYQVGQDLYIHGNGFTPNTTYNWVFKNPGANGTVLEQGSLTTDANGDVCINAFTLDTEHIGGPYQVNVGDAKNDNLRVEAGTPPVPTLGGLLVKKIVINDNGGTAATTSFSFKVNGGSSVNFEADGQNDLTLTAGTYSVVEDTASGYSTSYSGCSSVSVVAGATTTCTVTNDDNAPDAPTTGVLVVEKVVINDNGGSTATSSFSFKIDGVGNSTFFNSNGRAVVSGLSAGSHTVAEDAAAGYSVTYGGNCGSTGLVNIVAGATTTCVITNNDNVPTGPTTGTVIVHKVVINDNGGNAATSSFQFLINGGSLTNFEADGANNLTLAAGTYTITEATTTGYAVSYTNCSNIQIVAGQQAPTCVVTNNDIAQVPTDMCLNIEGNQETVPEGMTRDENGNCSRPENPTDVCANIEGNQSEVPESMELQDGDQCITPDDDDNGGGGGGSNGGGSRGIVLGINNDPAPQGIVLGATFELGLPATGNGPINTNIPYIAMFIGMVALVGLNLATFKTLKVLNK